MSKIESRVGKLSYSAQKTYNFLSDFNNFKSLIPPDRISDFESTVDSCRFKVTGIGEAALKIIEKEPNKLVKVAGEAMGKVGFKLWIQLKELAEDDTRIKLTVEAELNPMMSMVANKPLKNFVDMLVDQIEKIKVE
ncbi:MAG TPA: SRPBCC family protein [Bacteroidales bacterium]|nr:SRPBCC family protein [Bacteroidales bacterium]